MELQKSYILAVGIGVLAVLVTGVAVTQSGGEQNRNSTDWREVKLTDINSGEEFTVSELDKPVLVETFAVWCSTCTRQQQEIKKLHEESGVKSVSLNVDSNEDASKIRSHTERYGFDWRYAVSPSELTRKLIGKYGNSIAHPPSAPAVLVCENGTRKLPNGVKPVSKLKEEIQKGC